MKYISYHCQVSPRSNLFSEPLTNPTNCSNVDVENKSLYSWKNVILEILNILMKICIFVGVNYSRCKSYASLGWHVLGLLSICSHRMFFSMFLLFSLGTRSWICRKFSSAFSLLCSFFHFSPVGCVRWSLSAVSYVLGAVLAHIFLCY